MKDKISFFIGIPILKNREEINNFSLYEPFNDFYGNFEKDEKWYHIVAKVNNRCVGNISLFLDKEDNCRICTLFNLIVRIPYRGWGIGYQLVEKALCLCSKIKVDKIKVMLFEEDKIAINLYRELGFEIWK